MFRVGDRVVYPLHGAGIVEGIEEKELMGERKAYYIVYLPLGSMKVMFPVDRVESLGVREVVDRSKVDVLPEILSAPDEEESLQWSHRQRSYQERIRTGDLFEVASVFRTLHRRDKRRGLSAGERKIYELARQILVSEVAFVLSVDFEQAGAWIEGWVCLGE
ncbi:CarD family transcriptional regulator [Brockia lithotrophica]|uniref:CarD family transcriptional regulator n=1 Tax=Brockia lithotrophica TaxID=933949 RepID=A0A660L321_9BACL|nr:CarD family transcriptional regulator [Brockia lithotrophica]RKQ85595.1 CarD family transcriptional regulator [Brockia lithotrophica]